MSSNGRTFKGFGLIISLLLLGVELFLLGGYAYRGLFSRYLQDDYCYGAEVVTKGFFKAQLDSYFSQMPYNSDRFSLTLFSGIAEKIGGPYFVPFLAGLSIIAWAVALILAISQWSRYFKYQASRLSILISAFSILFFVLYLSPNLYQVLYWRSAMFPYLTPLIINTGLIGGYFFLIRQQKVSVISGIIFGFSTLIAGGFSETVGLWQIMLWGLLLFFFLLRFPRDLFAIKLLIIPLTASTLAILVMALGPANSAQLSPFKRPDLWQLVSLSLKYTQDYIRTTLRSLILPFFVMGCLGLFFGLQNLGGKTVSFRAILGKIILVIVFCYSSVFSVMIPTMLAMSSYPGDRALTPALFTLIISVFSIGWLGARFLTSQALWNKHLQFAKYAVLLLGLLLVIYVARTTPRIFDGLSAIQHRAEAWDLRHNSILEAKANGEMHVVVPAFDAIAVILELYPSEKFWVNSCAAKYYGIKGLSAIEGYNGVKPIFH